MGNLGQPVRGFVAPVGWGVAFGALIFGIGMQLGGDCGHHLTCASNGLELRIGVALGGFRDPVWRVSWPGVMTAILGGLLMGYGGRVAFGCNIGAFFSGVASSSLHGWLWLVCGFTGSIFGTYVRKWLGDGPYANSSAACKSPSR